MQKAIWYNYHNALQGWSDNQRDLTYRELWRCNKASQRQNTCAANMGTAQLEPSEGSKDGWPRSWELLLTLIKNHDLFPVSESSYFSDTEPEKVCCNTIASIHCGDPFNLFLKRTTLIYLGDCTLREEKYPNISRIVGLSVQVDINTLKSNVSSWLPY